MTKSELAGVSGIGTVLADTIVRFDRWDEADRLIEDTRKAGFQLVTQVGKTYPKLLKQLYDPPVLLWVLGDAGVLDTDGIAVVGTRKPSAYGIEMAEYFTDELVGEGLTVISGLAYGIDAAAHQAAIAGGGRTVAVLGSGIDRIYPSRHRGLARRITEQDGAVISEFPPGTNPDAGNFPVRNRVVSGLSLGTLVIESGMEGGSMITAKSALDQNREVFVVPHSLQNRSGAGCNHLIKTGQGKLVQAIEDILTEIAFNRKQWTPGSPKLSTKKWRWRSVELDEMATSICELLEDSPKHIDDLGEQLDLPVNTLLTKLLELEMQECVRQTAGRNFELR